MSGSVGAPPPTPANSRRFVPYPTPPCRYSQLNPKPHRFPTPAPFPPPLGHPTPKRRRWRRRRHGRPLGVDFVGELASRGRHPPQERCRGTPAPAPCTPNLNSWPPYCSSRCVNGACDVVFVLLLLKRDGFRGIRVYRLVGMFPFIRRKKRILTLPLR
jgi:hypothetical protein